jgi:two-component system, response regulator YesN
MRILIVDDEKYFRKALIVSVDWAAIGYEVCGEAENGMEALQKVELLLPDVIATDINMRLMDGLEFIDRLRNLKPDIKIVVISGYDDFDYVKRSIMLGVCNYIVKPIDPDEFTKTLVDITETIERERGLQARIDALRSNLNSTLAILKAQYISKILMGNVPSDQKAIDTILADNRIVLTQPPFLVISIEISPVQFEQWVPIDQKLWIYAVENIADELLSEKYSCEISIENFQQVLAIICYDGNETRLQQLLNSLCCFVLDNFKFAVTVGVGNPRFALQDVHSSCQEAVFAVRNSLPQSASGVIFYNNVSTVNFLSNRAAIYDKNELLMQMRLGNIEFCIGIIRKLRAALIESHATIQLVHVTLVEILSACVEYGNENSACLTDQVTNSYSALFSEIISSTDTFALFVKIEDILKQLINAVQKHNSESISTIVQKALDIIREKYWDDELDIECIAQKMYVSYGYLCFLFKKDMNQTINDYITDYRMEQALKLLLRGEMTISDIAARVGIPNPNYFSKIFKRKFNMLPSDFLKARRVN